jgi:DNA-binding MarR family transcriptional regulator
MDKPYASRILRVLGPRGLVSVNKDPTHGRRVIVEITPAGRELARTLLPAMHASQQQLLQVLDDRERAVLYRAIRKLQAAIPGCREQAAAAAAANDIRRTP